MKHAGIDRHAGPDFFREHLEGLVAVAFALNIVRPHHAVTDIQRERDGEKIYQMFSEEVRAGVPVDSVMFQLPPGMPVLNSKKK